jgi:hypothetical protein
MTLLGAFGIGVLVGVLGLLAVIVAAVRHNDNKASRSNWEAGVDY